MGAVADGAEAVEGGDAKRCGEIAVRGAAGRAFTKCDAHLRGQFFCSCKKSRADAALKRSAGEAAGDFEFCAAKNRFEGVQLFFDGAHIGAAKRAEIDRGSRLFGDDVDARATFHDVSVHGYAAANVVPRKYFCQLQSQFVNGVDAFFRREAGVRSFAAHDELRFADSFARRLEQARWSERRLRHEDGVAATRFRFEQLARSAGANFFVGGPKKNDLLFYARVRGEQRVQREERLNDSGFHVEDAGAVYFAAGGAKGHFGERSGGVDGVVMTENEKLATGFFCGARAPDDANVIAADFLMQQFDADIAFAPFRGDYFRAAVGRVFFRAGRLRQRENAQDGEHLR